MLDIAKKERERLSLQSLLDSQKSQSERNRLGQFATPTRLACDILKYARKLLPEGHPLRFLDPALGTGSFYSALLRIFGEKGALSASGFEIDDQYAKAAEDLWKEHGLIVRQEDFTQAKPSARETEKATLLICNPPYVRHHHLSVSEKIRLGKRVLNRYNLSLSGLSGLYCYFLCLSKDWMSQGGIAAWLIPSEFMDVNYGKEIKQFLLNQVTLLHIHRFSPEDAQFGDALVSSSIVWFKNKTPSVRHQVTFTYGGTINNPSLQKQYPTAELHQIRKWTNLPEKENGCCPYRTKTLPIIADYFDVKRGVATGANDFFILSSAEAERRSIPSSFLTPILPSPRYLDKDLIGSKEDGIPDIDHVRFLFSCDLPETHIKNNYPNVWRFLQAGRAQGIPERYICRNRSPWYHQEKRKPCPFLCTYMGRTSKNGESRPFRFILNQSNAIAPNVYLMLYPKPWIADDLNNNPELKTNVWNILRSIPLINLLGEGRVYGGGLHKLEPKELLNAPIEGMTMLFTHKSKYDAQMTLFQ